MTQADNERGRGLSVWIIVAVILLGAMSVINWFLYRQMAQIKGNDSPAETSSVQPSKPPEVQSDDRTDPPPQGPVTRRSHVVSGNDYWEDIFYRDGQEIARQRRLADESVETSGQIPDGKVTFQNTAKKTYGEEFYRHGRKHGTSMTYYEDGTLKIEELFTYGMLRKRREYYPQGYLRFEVDYSDARDPRYAVDEREVGIGKLYFPDGQVKYQWRFTNQESIGFTKSYNRDGSLRAEAYYDQYGNPLEDQPEGPIGHGKKK